VRRSFPDDPYLGSLAGIGTVHPVPFIVGVPRSGTTLLRLMLDAHPMLAIPAESGLLLSIVGRPPSGGPISPLELHRLAVRSPTWADSGLDQDEYLARLVSLHPFSVSGGVRAFYRLYSERSGKPRWGDKTPNNIERMAPISLIIPEARFVHIIRDGRDVALSLRDKIFSPGRDMSTLARFWMERITNARRDAEQDVPYLEIRFEELVLEPEACLRRICDFIDLDYSSSMLTYHLSARRRLDELTSWFNTDGEVIISKDQRLFNHRRTSEPPNSGRIGVWREEMTTAELSEFEAVAGDFLVQLGYEL
jgi:sulfotransferase family protein